MNELEMAMRIEGGCQCGAITYEAEVDPDKVGACHCTDCQAFSGAPYRASVPATKDDFKLTGTPTVYIKTAESGTKRAQAFCGRCGSAIYSSAADDPAVFNIRLGGCRQRAELKPTKRIWCDSALAWSEDISAITPQFARDR